MAIRYCLDHEPHPKYKDPKTQQWNEPIGPDLIPAVSFKPELQSYNCCKPCADAIWDSCHHLVNMGFMYWWNGKVID